MSVSMSDKISVDVYDYQKNYRETHFVVYISKSLKRGTVTFLKETDREREMQTQLTLFT